MYDVSAQGVDERMINVHDHYSDWLKLLWLIDRPETFIWRVSEQSQVNYHHLVEILCRG